MRKNQFRLVTVSRLARNEEVMVRVNLYTGRYGTHYHNWSPLLTLPSYLVPFLSWLLYTYLPLLPVPLTWLSIPGFLFTWPSICISTLCRRQHFGPTISVRILRTSSCRHCPCLAVPRHRGRLGPLRRLIRALGPGIPCLRPGSSGLCLVPKRS